MSDPVSAPDAPTGAGPRRGRWRRVLGPTLLLVVLVLAAAAVVRDRHEILTGLARLSPAVLVGSLVAVLAGLLANVLSWRAVLGGLGSPLPVPVASRVYLLAQLGKYLPGSLWPVLAQTELARDLGVPRARSALAAVLALIVGIIMGVVVAVVCLVSSSSAALHAYWYLGVAALLGVAVICPPVLRRLAGLANRVVRRPLIDAVPDARALAASAGWSLLMWACFGVHLWLVARGLGGHADRLLVLVTGAYAVAWVTGFLVFFVPAGAGAREAALVVVLGPALGAADALTLALVSRVMMLAGDLLAVAGAVAVARVAQRDRSSA